MMGRKCTTWYGLKTGKKIYIEKLSVFLVWERIACVTKFFLNKKELRDFFSQMKAMVKPCWNINHKGFLVWERIACVAKLFLNKNELYKGLFLPNEGNDQTSWEYYHKRFLVWESIACVAKLFSKQEGTKGLDFSPKWRQWSNL
jgi:hypothetical protein